MRLQSRKVVQMRKRVGDLAHELLLSGSVGRACPACAGGREQWHPALVRAPLYAAAHAASNEEGTFRANPRDWAYSALAACVRQESHSEAGGTRQCRYVSQS